MCLRDDLVSWAIEAQAVGSVPALPPSRAAYDSVTAAARARANVAAALAQLRSLQAPAWPPAGGAMVAAVGKQPAEPTDMPLRRLLAAATDPAGLAAASPSWQPWL